MMQLLHLLALYVVQPHILNMLPVSVVLDISNVAMTSNIPVAFGVLTTEDIEQAIERTGTKAGNKGADAALAALEMVNVIQAIKG